MKKSLCVIFIICLATLSAGALDPGELGFDIQSESVENGQTVYQGIDKYGNELTVVGAENLNDNTLKGLEVMLAILNGWKHLTIGSQRVVVKEDALEMVLLPKEFIYEGIDFNQYMPAGMQFFYTTYLEYDFRLYKDKLFLRVNGQIFNEKQFCDKLIKALENPMLYIQTHNPDYLIEQIGFLAEELEALKAENKAFRQEYDLLEEDHGNLSEQFNQLEEEHRLLQTSVMAFSNGNLFKLLQPLKGEVVEAVIQAKENAPEKTSKELAADLKTQGIDVTPKEAAIILAVFFNEFE